MAEVTWIKGTIDPPQSGEYYVTTEAKQDMVDPAVVCRGSANKCQDCRREYWMAETKTNDRCEEQTTPKENAGNDGERKNEPSAPEFLGAAAMKRVLQDEPVLRVIASLTLGPNYEQKMGMAREAVERQMQK